MDPSELAVLVLLGLVLLRGLLLALGAALLLRPVVECPACFGSTFPQRKRWLRWVLPWAEWRFCVHCGWQGPARRPEKPRVPPLARPRQSELPFPFEEPGSRT